MVGDAACTGEVLFSRRRAVLLVPVEIDQEPLNLWHHGPAPFRANGVIADAPARATYFDDRITRALYGDEEPLRWHRFVSADERPGFRGFQIDAAEVNRAPLAEGHLDGLMAIHGELPKHAPLNVLAQLARLPPLGDAAVRDWYKLVGAGAARPYEATKRATTLSFLTPTSKLPDPFPAGYEGWTEDQKWLWLMASATPFESYPPDPLALDELAASTIRFSRDWSALVLRDGVGFLGRRPDLGAEDPFYPSAELYFQSIYLDSLLLGMVQRYALEALADNVAALRDPIRAPGAVHRTERSLTEFRNVYWWTHLSGHGPANELNRVYGAQHRLPELSQQLFSEISEYSRQVQTAASEQSSAFLGLLTIIGLPLGAVVGVFQAMNLDSPVAFVLAAIGATLLSSLALGTVARPIAISLLRTLKRS
jgi:hypothetical protein